MQRYVLQTIFRDGPADPPKLGSYVWPFLAEDDTAARERADSMLGNFDDPNFVTIIETGNAARILLHGQEIAWRSLDPDNANTNWA